jgi:membrane protein YqaA with SNARE-associated domain
MTKRRQLLNLSIFLTIIGVGVFGSLLLTEYVIKNPSSQDLIQDFGVIGLFIISFVAGLNLLVPVPAATFVPVFTAGGMSLPLIISILVVGTMAANLLAYVAGRYGGKYAKSKYPGLQKKIRESISSS